MNRHDSISAGIFYPAEPEELSDMIKTSIVRYPIRENELQLPAALFVPHAAYDFVLDHITAACSRVAGTTPSKVVILAPLHREVLLEDTPHTIFYTQQERFETPGGAVRQDQGSLDGLRQPDSPLAEGTHYFEEEPAVDILFPVINHLFPDTPVVPILVGGSSAETASRLAQVITQLTDGHTLIMISMNLSAWIQPEDAYQHASMLLDQLTGYRQKRPPLLELYRHKRISSCGVILLEALHRTGLCRGPWEISSRPDTDIPSGSPASSGRRTFFGSGAIQLNEHR